MNKMTNVLAEHALTKARERYSRAEVADALARSTRQIARWEKGQSRIPIMAARELRRLADGPPRRREGEGESAFKFIDLFAGIGGIRLGFEAAGGECVFTSEWDPYAQKAYSANFPGDEHAISGDITAIDVADIPDHDVLLAGFPCQPFSLAGVSKKNSLGKPHGFECTTQGTLFFDVARIIAAKRPGVFLLENVKNLASHDGGNTLRVILQTLRDELNYKVSVKVIDGKHFVPQHRERILIVGIRDDGSDVEFDWSTVTLPSILEGPKLKSILHPEDGSETDVDDGVYTDADGKVRGKYGLTDHLWRYLQDYAAKHRAKGNGFGCSVVGPEDTSRTLSARYYKDGSEVLIRRPKGKSPRRLTPRECARLMGFPEDFKIVVSDTRAYKQFGNSVVVPLVRHVALALKPYIAAKVGQRQMNG